MALPDTTPVVAPTEAINELLLLHEPPEVASLRVVVAPAHIDAVPRIDVGELPTVIVTVFVQPGTVVYVTLVVPTLRPAKTPLVEPMVPTDVLLLLHVPPDVASLRVVVEPRQTVVEPVMACTWLTVTTVVAVLHPLPTLAT
jgi:hypothetical protein